MIIEEYIKIKAIPKTKGYYENLGYQWYGQNIEFECKTTDLLLNSSYKINLICDECDIKFSRIMSARTKQFNKYNKDLCPSCSKKGSYNSQYGKDRAELLKYAKTFQTINGMKNKHHTIETKKKMSLIKAQAISNGDFNIKSNNRGIKLHHYSSKNNSNFYADSALEKLRMIQLDNDENIESWTKKHKIKIAYVFNNEDKFYIPDFFIIYENGNKIIEEVKGRVTDIDLAKKRYAEIYCKENGYEYVFTTQEMMNKNGEYRSFLKKIKNEENLC